MKIPGLSVSVPSRGNGVIDMEKLIQFIADNGESFRPLSGKWGYRYRLVRIVLVWAASVSVPSRGNGVIDL